MRREFMAERQGKQFILYSGLLALGHEQGLKSIKTTLVQIPTEENKRVAIVAAVVVLEKDGIEREFYGLGDAAPNNVASAMVNCLIRLAETRAKARALRDAVNVGVAALEELGDGQVGYDTEDGAPQRGNHRDQRDQRGRGYPPRQNAPVASRVTGRDSRQTTQNGYNEQGGCGEEAGVPIPAELKHPAVNMITEAQMDAIRSLCRRRSGKAMPIADFEEFVNSACETISGKKLESLTQGEASEVLKTMQQRPEGKPIG